MTALSDFTDSEGNIDRKVDYSTWVLPGFVELDGESLVWGLREPDGSRPWVEQGPARPFFEDFLKLRNGTDAAILRFARRWGVLTVCEEHGLPVTHNPAPYPPPPYSSTRWSPCGPKHWPQGPCIEPISLWRHLSHQMHSLLQITSELRKGRPGAPSDWDRVYATIEEGRRMWGSASRSMAAPDETELQMQRYQVGFVVNEFLQLSGLRPRFMWSLSGAPKLQMMNGTMFGALTIQLALAVENRSGLAICSECHEVYTPQMRPRPNVANYCPRCRGLGMPRRNASKRYRDGKALEARAAIGTE